MPRQGRPEICICAAVIATDDTIIRGHRHADCIQTMIRMGKEQKQDPEAVGFITSANRFVNRRVAFKVQQNAHVPSAAEGGYRGDILYSEDLY